MNKAITDGVVLMPPAFANGLDVWSRGDGTPGSDTYATAANAAFVPADQDFGGCLEVLKLDATQMLRYMGETPLLPGCYLRVTARVKAISGNLPNVRIAAWAGGAGGVHVAGLTEVGPQVTLTSYGNIVEVSAIVGAGLRGGVDMVWGAEPLYGHFGLDLTGQNGGIVRIDDIVIEDITSVYLRDMMAMVDVRDFGAVGDGVSDDKAAFEAADAAAAGRRVLVSAGTYFLGDSVTFDSHVGFEGTVVMPDDKILSLTKDFHLPAYIDAFGNEELAFKKAFQALLNNSDHDTLDMGGRRITITGPIDMQAAVGNTTVYQSPCTIRNGQIATEAGAVWTSDEVTSQASYSPDAATTLTNVVNVANVQVGSLVTGTGVGREVYVRDKNVAAQEVTLSNPLYDAQGTQVFTFTRFKYLLDFSGFERLDRLVLENIDMECSGDGSGILLAPSGNTFQLREVVIARPRDRAITSHGQGCQGMLIDRCQFLSREPAQLAQDRTSVGLNVNANDVKLRDNRATYFRHFAVLSGSSNIVTGNHWFQGDGTPNGIRVAGLVLTKTNCRSTVTGNYIDNSFIEWTNEHNAEPNHLSGFSFSALSVTNNVFLVGDVAPWFSYLVVKPYGTGHHINGLSVTGNSFHSLKGNIDRVERVDTSFSDLVYSKLKNITFAENTYNQITVQTQNPLVLKHTEASASTAWVVDTLDQLPFIGWAQLVESVVASGAISNASNVTQYVTPYVQEAQGAGNDQVTLRWPSAVRGTVVLRVRVDELA